MIVRTGRGVVREQYRALAGRAGIDFRQRNRRRLDRWRLQINVVPASGSTFSTPIPVAATMSDDWITVIPEDPEFVPDPARQAAAQAWFEENAPDSEEIEIKLSDSIEFFDCGANFERVLCPSCGGEIAMQWWQQRMDEFEEAPKLVKYPTPCCGAMLNLHELVYYFPQGFGRFA